ncbi:O-succinylbenzoate-CoA ligase [Halodesulfurarchaeum formicicum]|uniref:O-succinylbenzoate-CoA ligase n=1 Tax=Halodesulfurarchaeum formicicum TaxID=1873524 RepID=A0A1D8S543_9EURY|nr:class I adenylate-forming enzyme family protein [Halodesulfurarchaeum formicicum]AOW80472.1 O-succinylbenzoate-CoA ligase [Halodesulfurarchaeum formicicum]
MDESLRRWASETPDRVALIDAASKNRLTYAELDQWADSIANAFVEHGIEPGDRVALLLGRKPAAIAAIWGVLRAGATLVPLDPDEPAQNLRSRCDRAAIEACICGSETAKTAEAVAPSGTDRLQIESIPRKSSRTRQFDERTHETGPQRLDRTRVVLFTSGTTGQPTGVRLTARNLGASAASTVARLGVTAADRWLLDLPIYHAGGLSIPIRTAMLGATTVLRRGFDAEATATTMAAYEVTGVSLVPTMLRRLLDGPGVPETLKFVLVGGAETPPSLVKQALEADVPIFVSYGMTETASGIATATPAELREDPETVGRPVRAASVSILGPDGASLDPGQVGEIAVSGAIVSPGTLSSERRRPRRAFRTGDRGRLSPAGWLTVTGRIDDLIVTGGENVSPRSVEAAIRETLPVKAVAVLGIPDAEWGERVAAAVVFEAGAAIDTETVRETLRSQIPEYALPKRVIALDSLPRTASGTVDRTALEEQFEEYDDSQE